MTSTPIKIEELEATVKVLEALRPEKPTGDPTGRFAAYTNILADVHQVIRNVRDIDDH